MGEGRRVDREIWAERQCVPARGGGVGSGGVCGGGGAAAKTWSLSFQSVATGMNPAQAFCATPTRFLTDVSEMSLGEFQVHFLHKKPEVSSPLSAALHPSFPCLFGFATGLFRLPAPHLRQIRFPSFPSPSSWPDRRQSCPRPQLEPKPFAPSPSLPVFLDSSES